MPGQHARQDNPSAQLGQLLLRGHTMLAEACPSCNIPLMKHPETLQSLCVGCQRSFSPAEVDALGDPQQQQPQQQPAAEPPLVNGPLHSASPGFHAPAAAAGGAAQQQARPLNGPLTSALARHPRRTTSNGGSSDGAGSPYLMPAQAPVTPAGAAPAGASVQSAPSAAGTLSPQSTGGASVVTAAGTAAAGPGAGVGAETAAGASVSGGAGLIPSRSQYNDSTDDEVLQAYQQIRAERQRAEQQLHMQHSQQSSSSRPQQQQQVNGVAAGAAAGGAQQRDVTQLMADKMVAGWALLGDHCPICSTPLMRERHTRQVYCVACDLPVRVEQQPAGTAAANSTGRDTQAAAADAAMAQQQQQQEEDEHRHAPAAGAGVAEGCTAAPAAVSFGVGADSLANAAGVGHQSQASGQLFSKQQVLSDLQQALLAKLHEARQHLVATPASQHEQLGLQLQVIQQLLQTLETTQQ